MTSSIDAQAREVLARRPAGSVSDWFTSARLVDKSRHQPKQ
jgi:hypothetical protein